MKNWFRYGMVAMYFVFIGMAIATNSVEASVYTWETRLGIAIIMFNIMFVSFMAGRESK